jgi:hypothetical protein
MADPNIPKDEQEDHPFGYAIADMDVEAFLNIRDWLEQAVKDAGAEVTDGGIGMGQADIGVSVEGMPYGISIKPRPIRTET